MVIFGRGYRNIMIRPCEVTTTGKASLAETLFQKLFGKRYFLADPGISRKSREIPGNPRISRKSWEILGFPGNPGKSWGFRSVCVFSVFCICTRVSVFCVLLLAFRLSVSMWLRSRGLDPKEHDVGTVMRL